MWVKMAESTSVVNMWTNMAVLSLEIPGANDDITFENHEGTK